MGNHKRHLKSNLTRQKSATEEAWKQLHALLGPDKLGSPMGNHKRHLKSNLTRQKSATEEAWKQLHALLGPTS